MRVPVVVIEVVRVTEGVAVREAVLVELGVLDADGVDVRLAV